MLAPRMRNAKVSIMQSRVLLSCVYIYGHNITNRDGMMDLARLKNENRFGFATLKLMGGGFFCGLSIRVSSECHTHTYTPWFNFNLGLFSVVCFVR